MAVRTTTSPFIRQASISPGGIYRYYLSRQWRDLGPWVVFVMLNPSVADDEVDDPTVRRCVGFARRWGYGGVEIVNLFALRLPSPGVLRAHRDPIGPECDDWLQWTCRDRDVVLAWGAAATACPDRVRRVLELIGPIVNRTSCLGQTREGHPRHPLFVPYSQERVAFHWSR